MINYYPLSASDGKSFTLTALKKAIAQAERLGVDEHSPIRVETSLEFTMNPGMPLKRLHIPLAPVED